MKLAKALVLVFVLSSFAFMPTCSAVGDKVRAFVGQALEITSGFDTEKTILNRKSVYLLQICHLKG